MDEDWFHGVLPREEVVRLLVNDGDYLVRQTTRNDETQVVLSVAWGGHKHFIVQTTSDVSPWRAGRVVLRCGGLGGGLLVGLGVGIGSWCQAVRDIRLFMESRGLAMR